MKNRRIIQYKVILKIREEIFKKTSMISNLLENTVETWGWSTYTLCTMIILTLCVKELTFRTYSQRNMTRSSCLFKPSSLGVLFLLIFIYDFLIYSISKGNYYSKKVKFLLLENTGGNEKGTWAVLLNRTVLKNTERI